jgi:NADH:ubiquinone oxidoreductase subunit 6 (subunit J)
LIRMVFGVISCLGLLMALGTVLAKNLVHAALFLVAFFFLIACHFILLEAEFMAAIQVLVYIGAVAILLMFGIMLTRNIQGDETTSRHWMRAIPAAAAGLGVLAVLLAGIWQQNRTDGRPSWATITTRKADPQLNAEREQVVNDMTRVVGNEMMTRYIVPFEVAGLLLTAAVVGSVAIAIGEGGEEDKRRGATKAATATVAAAARGGPALTEALSTPRA